MAPIGTYCLCSTRHHRIAVTDEARRPETNHFTLSLSHRLAALQTTPCLVESEYSTTLYILIFLCIDAISLGINILWLNRSKGIKGKKNEDKFQTPYIQKSPFNTARVAAQYIQNG